MENARRVISVIVLNEASVLSRIVGLFSGRGYNIESLTVAPIPDSKYSRITIVTAGSLRVIEQITKQLHKLIPVLKVYEHADLVEKEMAMVKIPMSESLGDIEELAHAMEGVLEDLRQTGVVPDQAVVDPTELRGHMPQLLRAQNTLLDHGHRGSPAG